MPRCRRRRSVNETARRNQSRMGMRLSTNSSIWGRPRMQQHDGNGGRSGRAYGLLQQPDGTAAIAVASGRRPLASGRFGFDQSFEVVDHSMPMVEQDRLMEQQAEGEERAGCRRRRRRPPSEPWSPARYGQQNQRVLRPLVDRCLLRTNARIRDGREHLGDGRDTCGGVFLRTRRFDDDGFAAQGVGDIGARVAGVVGSVGNGLGANLCLRFTFQFAKPSLPMTPRIEAIRRADLSRFSASAAVRRRPAVRSPRYRPRRRAALD